ISMAVMPLLSGDRDTKVAGTRKVLITSALIMSALLLGSALVTTVLMPADGLRPGGVGHARALGALAHGQGLADGIDPDAVNPLFGRTFGTLYDLVTVLVLCLAGASVTLAMKGLLPQFLLRFGMEMRWAYDIGAIFYLFMLINMAITVLFRASVDAQRSAYAVSVL